MASRSLSQLPFGSGDYDDGEILPLVPDSPVWIALHAEVWMNVSPIRRSYLLYRLDQPHYFSGYIVSTRRGQIELTFVPFDQDGVSPGRIEILSITLPTVRRFL